MSFTRLFRWNCYGASHSNECIVVQMFDVIAWTSYIIIIINIACFKQLLFVLVFFPFYSTHEVSTVFLLFYLFFLYFHRSSSSSVQISIENNFQRIPQRWNYRSFWHFFGSPFLLMMCASCTWKFEFNLLSAREFTMRPVSLNRFSGFYYSLFFSLPQFLWNIWALQSSSRRNSRWLIDVRQPQIQSSQ